MKIAALIIILTTTFSFMELEKKYTMLCLGDSYTIGESVEEQERFPMQTVELLKSDGIAFEKPTIIAKTGWTTDELATAIKSQNLQGKYDYVTLLIGVNNQYRERSPEEYRVEFKQLLKTAIEYAGGNVKHVFVISIPDWGATPFIANDGRHRSAEQVGKEIDNFNAIAKEESQKGKVDFIDITPSSRKATAHPDLVAADGLHPSGKMYAEWSKLLAEKIKKAVFSK